MPPHAALQPDPGAVALPRMASSAAGGAGTQTSCELLLIGSSLSKGLGSRDEGVAPHNTGSKFYGWAQRLAQVLSLTHGLTLNQLSVSGSGTNQWTDPAAALGADAVALVPALVA